MRYSSLIALICMLAAPAYAHDRDCRPVFATADQAVIINRTSIEPGGKSTQDFQVQIQNEAEDRRDDDDDGSSEAARSERCEAAIRIVRIGPVPAPDFPPYGIRAAGNRSIEILPDPYSGRTPDSDVEIANVPPGPQGRTVQFQISVPTDWSLRAGTYTEQLQLLLIDERGKVRDQSTLTTTIIIPTAVSLRLVGAVVGGKSHGPAQIDLGNLSNTSETRSDRFGARIFSTSPYTVQFSSVNLGNLLHEHGGEEIPYRLYFDGSLIDLGRATEIPYPSRPPESGDNRAMSIVVPPVTALAGRYSDRITITVAAM